MDSWKGSLSALAACESVARGLRHACPAAELRLIPMADGGEGTIDVVERQSPGIRISCSVCGPLPDRRVAAHYLLWPDRKEALIEMAACAGLPLLRDDERDPLRATTFGVGELIADALRHGVKKIHLAAGGSATVDAGTGMAAALGWTFLDAQGAPLPLGGGALTDLRRILPPPSPLPADLAVEVWCDVTNPLTGPRGAAAVFAPQKGARPADVVLLESALTNLAEVVRRDLRQDIATDTGSGAAGGLAAGAVAFLRATLVSGIDTLSTLLGIDTALRDADWVITGEGRFDSQSLQGKLVSGILARARKYHTRVAVLAGSIALDDEALRRAGVEAAVSANPFGLPLPQALAEAPELCEAAARRLAPALLRPEGEGRF